MREKYISFAHFVYFLREVCLFSMKSKHTSLNGNERRKNPNISHLSQANAQNLELQSNLQKSDIDSSSLYVRLQEQVNIKWLLNFPFQFYCTHSLDR